MSLTRAEQGQIRQHPMSSTSAPLDSVLLPGAATVPPIPQPLLLLEGRFTL